MSMIDITLSLSPVLLAQARLMCALIYAQPVSWLRHSTEKNTNK